jgi:glycosyltransferase involved in cell wall biosynthesis
MNADSTKGGRDTESQESKRLIVRHCGNAHPHICVYLVQKHGFTDMCRLPEDSGLKSKLSHLRDLIFDAIYLLRNLDQLRDAREIIALGPMAPNVALLLKLGLLPCCLRLYWFGLFIHHPRWFRVLRPAFRILDSKIIQYVLFSNFEKTLYTKSLLLSEDRLFYVPYGDLSNQNTLTNDEVKVQKDLDDGEFFFSGGYSNRDYLSLIAIFGTLPYKLVIVCSALNTEIDESVLSANIKVLRELPSEVFDAYLRTCKACIIPIAHDSGAAGQSVLLRCMKNRKIIIATDTGIVREYLTDGVSGMLVKNNHEAMMMAVRAVAGASIESYKSYGDAAYESYLRNFSGEATATRLDEMVTQDSSIYGNG